MNRSNSNDRARLLLSEPQAVYYAGQEICGHIELEIQNPIQFSAINVTFHGEARVHWSEVDYEEYNGARRARNVAYNGVQVCLDHTQCLYGAGLGHSEGIIDISSLPSGNREIPFKYTLPYNIPSSFKGEKGNILYSVIANVEYLNHIVRDQLYIQFEVVAPMDLLTDDIVRPLEMHFEEVYSCWCSGCPMRIDIKCPVSGYCPGQSIPINVKVHNESTVEVKKIVFQIVKKEIYRTQQPPSEYSAPEEVLAAIKTGAILSNSDKGFTCHLPVPAMIAPNLDNCEVIDIGFFLKAIIKLTGCNDDLEDEALFFIGLKPIPGTPGAENYVHPLAHKLPNGAPIPDPPLRANVEQVFRPNSYSYPGQNTIPYPAQNTSPYHSPYPAPNTGSRPNSECQPMSSYLGQNLAPYPTENSGPPGPERYPPSKPTDGVPPYPSQPNPSARSTLPYPPENPPYPPENPLYPTPNPPYPTPNPPYPTPNSPHPAPNPPYPTLNSPHPTPNSPHPIPYSPHPAPNPPFPTPYSPHPAPNPPYPTLNSPHPTPNSPHPIPNSPHPDPNPPYPTLNSPHPTPNSPHPIPNSPHPAPNPPYPTPNSPYPAPKPPYPTPNSAHPTPNSPHPAPNSLHPAPNSLHPAPNPPYPTPNSAHPTSNSPHPAPNPPYPTPNSAHTTANSPYPTPYSPHLASNPPDPKSESMSMTPLRTQTIGFVLPRGSPYPKADDQNSPYTPLMQTYPSPSAPPPSS